MNEAPDTIHGRMKEGAHLAGYGLSRAMDNLKWLLEGEKYKELAAKYPNVNEFLRDTKDAFQILKINPGERKQIASLIKELQPGASQRAIADMVGSSQVTIGRDLGTIDTNVSVDTEKKDEIDTNVSPLWTTDDKFDPSAGAQRKLDKKVKKEIKEKEIQASINAYNEVPEDERYNIFQADINTVEIDQQFDFIITDPPYPKEYLPLYEVLAKRATEWLKPDGLLVAMCGQSYLDKIMIMMSNHLDYYWMACYHLPGQPTPLRQRQVNCSWKPILIYGNKDYKGKIFSDFFVSEKPDKQHHEWGQSVSGMSSLISQICLPGQTILDPFLGAGTTAIATLGNQCLFTGFDIDENEVNKSLRRINDKES